MQIAANAKSGLKFDQISLSVEFILEDLGERDNFLAGLSGNMPFDKFLGSDFDEISSFGFKGWDES